MKAVHLFIDTQLAGGPCCKHNIIILSLFLVPGDAPSIISVMATSFSSIRLTWQPPRIPNGAITDYTITTLPSAPSQPISLNGSQMSYEIQGLMAFTNYTISLSASTSAGEGPANTTQERTLEDGKRDRGSIFLVLHCASKLLSCLDSYFSVFCMHFQYFAKSSI